VVSAAGPLKVGPMITNDSRLDVRVPASQRRELEQLAKDAGVSVGGLVRLATQRLLNDRGSLLRGSQQDGATA
jgi:hypothetical protein